MRYTQKPSRKVRLVGAFLPPSRIPNPTLLSVLATSFLSGEAGVEQIAARCAQTLGQAWPWLRPLAQRYLKRVSGSIRPRRRDVVRFLSRDRGLKTVFRRRAGQVAIEHWIPPPAGMQPAAVAQTWDVPPLESIGALADWLRVTPRELEWFADLKGLGYKTNREQLRHYNYRVLSKNFGAVRLIEMPKPRLKELQRQILSGILEMIPPHDAAHGFLKGRSIKTFTAPHTGRRVVLRMDLRDFFPSFYGARIQTLFRMLGYPEPVADLLGGICTNAVPREVWNNPSFEIDSRQRFELQNLYGQPHLPQGAPASPALANICFYRLDCRLAGLARAAGAEYTRYADDLAFSGGEEFEGHVDRFSTHAAAILMEEGFVVHHRKTRVMRQGVRQHLAGIVLNRRANIMRPDFDRLKAILTNCIRTGPDSQNRESHPAFRSHLEGRVAFAEMINPGKAKRIRLLFEKIQWP